MQLTSVRADAAPTQQQYASVDALSNQANPLIAQWKQIMSTDLVALNDMMQKENVPAIYIAPVMGEGSAAKAAGQH
jgi:acetylornithine/succinyldiaminopimelate/putrescine aminotransferase